MLLFPRMRRTVLALSVTLVVGAVQAADGAVTPVPLVEGQGVAITEQDVLGNSLRMPANLRTEVLSRPHTAAQLASNLYIYRSLAQQARAEGLDQRPEIAAALQTAQEKVLADAWLAALDEKTRPSLEAATAQAEAIYKAEPKRFTTQAEVHVRHILVAGQDEAARAKAQQVLESLQGGADFAELAKNVSDDKSSGARGGDLGFFGRGKMVPAFEEAAFALKQPGELSGLVQTQFGFHILRLEALRPAGLRPFEEVRDALVEDIRQRATQNARALEAGKLRQRGVINEDAVARFAKQQADKAAAAPK